MLLYIGEQLEGVITVEIVDDKITNFYVMRNPDKLAALARDARDQPRTEYLPVLRKSALLSS